MNTGGSDGWRETVASADRERLAERCREGARIVGIEVMDGAAVLQLVRRPEWSLPPSAAAEPPLDVAIERLEPPLSPDVVAAIEHIHTTVFGQAPGTTYSWLQTRPGASCFVARHEGWVVGFKFGAERNPRQHHSHEGGVPPGCRRRGVARALMVAQHEWARSWGATVVTTNTMNDFVPMLLLNLSVGFEVVGVEARNGQTKLRMRKPLR